MANNGKTSASLSNQILDAFEILAQAEVNSAQFDKTVTGIVISCEDEATGRYKIQYQDAIFYAYSSAIDVTYTKGTSVQVKIPNNDFSGRKIIIGTVEENGIDYGTLVEDPLLRYEYIGVDCIGSTEQYDLSSYWSDEKNNIILYDIEQNIDLLDLNEQMIEENLKQADSILLGATIQTNIPDVQKFKGDYGIKYTLTFNDIANVEAKVDRYYIIDIDKMSGDPYAYDKATDQMIPFDIDSKNYCYIKKIELFAKHFIYKDDEKPADIFISNLRFQTANRLSDEEFAGTALTIVTPEGNYFTQAENLSSKQVLAQLRMKGKVVNNSLKKVEYYWFIEDLRIYQTNHTGYHRYGGRGWRCLNEYAITEGDETNPISIEYIAGKETFTIKKDNSKARNTKYKCVINYNGQILEREFYFINYNVINEVIITANRNPNFINNIGATTLLCTATNGIKYQWAKIDAEGGFEALRETTAENNEYENAAKEYDKLRADIETKKEPDNEANQKLLRFYLDILESYQYKERRKENQIINLQAKTIFQEAIFKCQAFDENDNNLGIATQLVTNYISAEENLQTGSLIINNGTQVFKYDANGIAPTNGQFENPQVILPLSFILRNAQGIEIPMDALNNQDITWIVPIKNTMLKNYIGNVISHDEENGIEVYNGKSLGYNISENYYSNKDNNEIELRVQYQGLVYIAKTNFLFTKDGDSGTNGTGYILKLVPSVDSIGKLKTVVPSEDIEMGWLRAQLWHNGIKIYEGDTDGKAITGGDVKLTWSLLGELHSDYGTAHNITVENNDSGALWFAKNEYDSTAIDIVKAVVEYDGERIVATAPIIYSPDLNTNIYKVSLKQNTGFTHVLYSSDGLTPTYDNHTPFELTIHKKIQDSWGDLTGHSSFSYYWTLVGNLRFARGYENLDEQGRGLGYSTLPQIMVEPIGIYNSDIINNAIICTIKEGSLNVGTFHIPIHFLVNTYGNSALNDWDGNSLSVNVESNVMLSPQGGFGKKEADNSYTGVFLGTVKDYENNVEHTGLFGYASGNRTIFLNSETGSAIFGKVGKQGSSIVIDPNSDIGRLYTNNFYDVYDEKTGLPLSYTTTNETGEGALIDLTSPEIRWGNGNFQVTKEGYITAKGGGTIAGWNIDNYKLYKNNTGMSSVFDINDENGVTKKTIKMPDSTKETGYDNIDKAIAFWAGNNNFFVSHDGYLKANEASIGSGTNPIFIGQSTGDKNYSAIFSGKKSAFNVNANGFYIGTDGIALGSHNTNGENKFQVTNQGVLTAREGTIGGWTINRTTLTGGNITLNSNGSMSGGSTYTWSISTNGTATFNRIIANTGGSIGGWTIGSNSLSAGNITLNSNGSISGGDSSHSWSIGTNGHATFNSATITGTVTANKGKVGNWSISSGAISNGNVTLTSDGKIVAKAGTIGGWNIDSVQLQKTTGKYSFEIRTDRASNEPSFLVYHEIEGYKFYVRPDGYLYAKKAYIEGEINATSGTFSGTLNSAGGTFTGKLSGATGTFSGSLSAATGTFKGKLEAATGTFNGSVTAGTTKINSSGLHAGYFSISTQSDAQTAVFDGLDWIKLASYEGVEITSTLAVKYRGDFGGWVSAKGFSSSGGDGASGSFWIMTGWTSAENGYITFKGRNCTFSNGIITSIGGETTATTGKI